MEGNGDDNVENEIEDKVEEGKVKQDDVQTEENGDVEG